MRYGYMECSIRTTGICNRCETHTRAGLRADPLTSIDAHCVRQPACQPCQPCQPNFLQLSATEIPPSEPPAMILYRRRDPSPRIRNRLGNGGKNAVQARSKHLPSRRCNIRHHISRALGWAGCAVLPRPSQREHTPGKNTQAPRTRIAARCGSWPTGSAPKG
jgi:hypothetical protein